MNSTSMLGAIVGDIVDQFIGFISERNHEEM